MNDCKTVALRTRPLKNRMLSFYLDYYPGYRDKETMKVIHHLRFNNYQSAHFVASIFQINIPSVSNVQQPLLLNRLSRHQSRGASGRNAPQEPRPWK